MTVTEAAAMMGVSRQNINHLIHTGRLRARRQGRRWLVSAEDARKHRPMENKRP